MLFKIHEFQRNQLSLREIPDDKDPRALYDWTVSEDGKNWTVTSGGEFSEYEILLSHLGIPSLSDLSGMSVDIPDELDPNISDALRLLVLMARNGGAYSPPSRSLLVERILDALSELKPPDFSDADSASVCGAAREIFYGQGNCGMRMSDERLAWLVGKIVSRSDGKIVSVNRSESSNFPSRVRGPAEYFEFEMSDGTRRKVIFGPYAMPVEILD